MQAELTEFLGAPAHLSLKDILLARLAGIQFGRPISERLGEGPDEALIQFFSRYRDDPSATAQLTDVLNELWRDTLQEPLVQTNRGAKPSALLAYYRIFSIMRAAGLAPDRRDTLLHLRRFVAVDTLSNEQCAAFWTIVLAVYRDVKGTTDEVPVTTAFVLAEEFLPGIAPEIAVHMPIFYLDRVLPVVARSLLKDGRAASRMRFLSNSVRLALSEAAFTQERTRPYAEGTIERTTLLISQLRTQNVGRGDVGNQVAAGILEGVRRSKAKFAHVVALEASAALKAREAPTLPRNIILRNIFSTDDDSDPILMANDVPFAEGVFFKIWADLISRSKAKKTIVFKRVEWADCVSELQDRKLSFLIGNEDLYNIRLDDEKYFKFIPGFMIYRHYPIVISEGMASYLLQHGAMRENHLQEYVADLAAGDCSSYDLGASPFKEILDVVASKPGLRVGLPIDTDLHRAFNEAFSGQPLIKWCDRSPEQSLSELISDKIDMAIVGGLHGQFARKCLRGKLKVIGYLPKQVQSGLIFYRPTFEALEYESRLIPMLKRAWNQVPELWDRYQQHTYDDSLNDYFDAFMGQINEEISVPFFDGDPDTILEVVRAHTTLVPFEETPDPGTFETAPKLSVVPSQDRQERKAS